VLRLPQELARVDTLLDDLVFFAPFAPFFGPRLGRPSTPYVDLTARTPGLFQVEVASILFVGVPLAAGWTELSAASGSTLARVA
jgi:hypothetical protein